MPSLFRVVHPQAPPASNQTRPQEPRIDPVPAPWNKVPLETLGDALAIGEGFFGRSPEKKKYRRVRLSKMDLEYILSYKSSPMPHPPYAFLTDEKLILDGGRGGSPVPKEQVVDYFTLLFYAFDGADDDFLEMQKRVNEE